MPETNTLVDREAVASAPPAPPVQPAPLVQFLRGGHVESVHYGHVAVVDSSGSLIAWAGDPRVPIFPRSAFKPFQALPLAESGIFAKSGLGPEALALIAGSHGGTDQHVALVLRILKEAGAEPSALRCGAHVPYDEPTAAALAARGEAPTPLRNNCSGKHAGMLLLSREMAAPFDSYIDPSHPVQRRIFERFAALLGEPFADAVPAIDGCSAPTPRMPLATLARAFSLLARGEDVSGRPVPGLAAIRDAMRSHPENVAGAGQLDTVLMQRLSGTLVCKGGAEGVHAAGLLGSGVGIAVKVADGSRRARKAAVLAVLDQLHGLSVEDRAALVPLDSRILRNSAGLAVGSVRPALALEMKRP